MKDVVWRYELGYNGIGWGVFGVWWVLWDNAGRV